MGMVMRVQRVDGEFRVVLSVEAVEALKLSEGAEVEVFPVKTDVEVRYASIEDALAAYERTEPLHRNTYRELAK